jgi:predicted nucleotidyltransferase
MRLSENNVTTVKSAVQTAFSGQPKVFLFGSRVYDDKRGGDIDLMVVSDLQRNAMEAARIVAITKLQLALGEQTIDLIVTSDPASDSRPVVREAFKHGIEL